MNIIQNKNKIFKMTPEQLSKLTDQEVLAEVKKNKSKSTVRAGSMVF